MKAALAIAAVVAGADALAMVQTPHGMRPAKCVHKVDEAAHLTETAEGTHVYLKESKRSYVVPRDEDCVRDVARMAAEHNAKEKLGQWEDYTSWSSSEPLYNFTSTYTTPNENPPKTSQLLYYFIGFQNMKSGGVTIAQPVVQYSAGSSQYAAGWGMEPWNCCPSGQTWHGKTYPVKAGSQQKTWVYTQNDKVEIGMSNIDGSNRTDLTIGVNGRIWDWAAATLETYTAPCASVTKQPYQFDKMVITGKHGKQVTPQWKGTGETSCNGGAIIHSPASVSVYGADKPSQ